MNANHTHSEHSLPYFQIMLWNNHWMQLRACVGYWWDKDAGTKLPTVIWYFAEWLGAKRTNRQTYPACGKWCCCPFLKVETSTQSERNRMTAYQHQDKCTSLLNAVPSLRYQHRLTQQSFWSWREQSTWKGSWLCCQRCRRYDPSCVCK